MKTTYKVSLLFALPMLTMSLASFKATSDSIKEKSNISFAPVSSTVIRLVNVEDYIYINDPKHGYEEEDLTIQFEKYVEENYPEFGDVEVIYNTTDTPETMYNELKTGKSRIDLVCPSDYMIQKMLAEEMLEPINRDHVPHYRDYASPVISNYIDSIEAHNKEGQTLLVGDYCVGYMWGTLGILFNPEYQMLMNRGLDFDMVMDDMQSWNVLWNKSYNGTISIKDSIRDTLAVAIMHHFDEELTTLRSNYVSGSITLSEYKSDLDNHFNIFSNSEWNNELEELRNAIYHEMIELKGNIYGLEVDNGKNDIVTQKIGVNLAWSGDAVYAMSQAQDPNETSGKPFDLYYSVPENGSNIWFDGWVMPKNSSRSAAQTALAELFLDYISNPENTSKNMDYTGYTPFIGGYDILSLTRDWYDVRTDELYEEDYDVYYYDTIEEEYVAIGYDDMLEEYHDSSKDEMELFYNEGSEEEPDWKHVFIRDEEDEPTETVKTYGDLPIVDSDDSEYDEVDLSYFFEGTLKEEDLEEGEEVKESDYLFYADGYYAVEDNISVGGDFFTQFPDEDTIDRCCVMKDFGANNKKVLELWEDFKSGELKPFVIIILSIEIGVALAVGIYAFTKKRVSKVLRNKRKAERHA